MSISLHTQAIDSFRRVQQCFVVAVMSTLHCCWYPQVSSIVERERERERERESVTVVACQKIRQVTGHREFIFMACNLEKNFFSEFSEATDPKEQASMLLTCIVYTVAGANKIVAQPGTITGSIGVAFGKFDVSQALQDQGISVDTVAVGRNATASSLFHAFTKEQQHQVNTMIDRSATVSSPS